LSSYLPDSSIPLPGLSKDHLGYRWDAAFLKETKTQQYLQAITGLDSSELGKRGIKLNMAGSPDELATDLIFERTKDSPRGTLYTMVKGERKVLSDSVSLMRMTRDSPDMLHADRFMNRAAHGVLQALDLWNRFGWEQHAGKKVFKLHQDDHDLLDAKPKDEWFPVPSITGKLDNLDDLGRRTALLRAVPAFEMERFGRLASGFARQTFGPEAEKLLKSITGLGLETLPGPSLHTFGRIGARAALVGGGLLAVSQSDWIRRNYGILGHAGVSAGVSAGIGYTLNRMGARPHVAMFGAAASFFGQMVLPGFDQGVLPGLATVYARTSTMRAHDLNPFNYYRRTLEGFLPGSSDWKTGAFLALGTVLATQMRVPGSRHKLPQYLLTKFGHHTFGLEKNVLMPDGQLEYVKAPRTARDIFWKQVTENKDVASAINVTDLGEVESLTKRMTLSWRLGKAQWESSAFGNWTDLGGLLNKTWMTAENIHHKELDYNSVNQALLNRLDKISADFPGSDYVSRISKEAMGAGAQAWYSFFGADATHEATASAIRAKGFGEIPLPNFLKHVSSSFPTSLPISPTAKLGAMASVGLAVFGLHQLVTGSLFGSMETASELDDIYSGRELVKVKKSRFWEAGGTPFGGMEGGAYFRPHAYALMMNRVREKGIWGEDEDSISPIGKFFRKNFTYDLETMHYYDRPYPISSAAFADVPVIGGILSSLVGQFIKPPKLMHTGEWIQEGEGGGLAFGSLYEGWRREPAYSLGAPKPGIPASPYDTSHVFSQMTYQFRELEGLCFVGDTLITTEHGYKPIRDVAVGESVLSLNGQYLKVEGKLVIPKHSKQLVKVSFFNTGTSFIATSNHWLPVLRDGVVTDLQVSDLQKKDYVVVPLPRDREPVQVDLAPFAAGLNTERYIYWERSKSDFVEAIEFIEENGDQRCGRNRIILPHLNRTDVSHAAKRIRENLPIKRWKRFLDLTDEDVLWFLGWFVAEGSTEIANSRIALTLGWKEREIANRLKEIAVNKLGCLLQQECLVENSSITLRFSHGGLVHWLRSQFGRNCYEKHVPEWVKQLPQRLLVHFASGLCNGDGWAGGFKSCSATLVKDVFLVLAKLSICSNVQLHRHDKQGLEYSQLFITERHLENYTLVLNRQLPEILDERPSAHKYAFLSHRRLYIPVKCINYLDTTEPVYDLTIQGHHYYTAELIAVHNTGWSKNLISEMVTGSSAIGTDQPVLKTSSEMTSWTNRFLETQQGGLFFSNEIIRRILGKPQSGFDRQNPIMNDMPTWMPQRFKYGDPYRAVEWGEARMPGPGFAALHPELRGTSPEDYPMLYRYSILADVAPWTHELRWTREQLYQQRGAGLTSGAENQYMDEIDKQLREKYNRYTFDQARAGAIELPGSQITQALHSIAKQGLRRFAAPVEYLIPFGFRPVQKLMGDDRSMIEQYKYERMSGTPFAFWNKPWRDWFRPSILSALNAFGFDNKPEWRKEADANQEYFDKLEFVKWMTLAQQASDHGDVRLSHQYKYMAAGTRTGINPQGNPLSIYWSMPESERAFFNSFSFAQGGEREKILNMVPEDQAHLYQAVWERMDSGDPGLWAGSPSSVDDQYLAQQFRGAQEYFDYNPRPPDDWIGHNSDADIGDIRVRYLTEMGRDLHDYGEWEGSVKDAYAQEFYEGSTDFLPTGGGVGRGTLWSELKRLSGNAGSTLHTNASVQTRANIQYNDNRDSDFRKGLMDYLYGY
jgi:intein/homing endonuclease